MPADGRGSSKIVPLRADTLPGTHAHPSCRACGCETGYLARYIQSNNNVAIRWVCDWCEDYGTTGDLPAALARQHGVDDLAELPLRIDHSGQALPRNLEECVACGSWEDDTEQHHWAPAAIFPDWPIHLTVTLCKACHRAWHRRMRQHGLRWPHETGHPQITVKTRQPDKVYVDPEDIEF